MGTAGGQGARADGCFSWTTLLPHAGWHLGTAQTQTGSAGSRLSPAVACCVPPLPSLPAHCSPAAALLPFRHPTGRGQVWVWEPRLGGFPGSCILLTPLCYLGALAEPAGTWADSHPPCDPGVSIWTCALWLPTLPAATACPQEPAHPAEQGRAEPELPPSCSLACGQAGTWLCAVTPHERTLSKCQDVQDMNQPQQEHSSHSWTI